MAAEVAGIMDGTTEKKCSGGDIDRRGEQVIWSLGLHCTQGTVVGSGGS